MRAKVGTKVRRMDSRSGNCKAAKTEMVWARDKIRPFRRRNQSDTSGNNGRQPEKGQAEEERWTVD